MSGARQVYLRSTHILGTDKVRDEDIACVRTTSDIRWWSPSRNRGWTYKCDIGICGHAENVESSDSVFIGTLPAGCETIKGMYEVGDIPLAITVLNDLLGDALITCTDEVRHNVITTLEKADEFDIIDHDIAELDEFMRKANGERLFIWIDEPMA